MEVGDVISFDSEALEFGDVVISFDSDVVEVGDVEISLDRGGRLCSNFGSEEVHKLSTSLAKAR